MIKIKTTVHIDKYEIDIEMNSKLVLWGMNAQDEKILIAMELLVEENKVKILTFPDALVIDDFYDKMRNEWREGKKVEIIEGHTEEIRDLTASETLLPEHIKVTRTDLIERKQLEWHVLVLSNKMYKQFKAELESIKEKVDALDKFDSAQWEALKTFWAKVQTQIKDGILTRSYATDLRKGSDELFDKLKTLRKKLDEEYRSVAKENFDWFVQKLDGVEKKIEEGLRLSGVFDELKDLQRKFHNTKFTREFRDKIWSRIDVAFKTVKEKKYGKKASNNDGSALGRLSNRYEGLIKAIKRSEFSRDRDLKDLEYEKKRIQNTDGQLEAQIREAKIKMINQRLKFKEDKLKEMYATQKQLDTKMDKMKEKERLDKIRREKEAAAKAKIQEAVKTTTDNLDDATKQKLAAAAEEINESKNKGKKKTKDFVEKVMDTVDEVREMIEEKVEDTYIAAKAAAVVITEEVNEKMEPYSEKGREIIEDLTAKAGEKMEEAKEAFSSAPVDAEIVEDTDAPEEDKGILEKVMDKVGDIREAIEEKAEDAIELVEDKIEEGKEGKGFMGKAFDALGSIKETVTETIEDVAEKLEPYTEKGKEVVEDLTAKATGVVNDVTEDTEDIKKDVTTIVEDVVEDIDTDLSSEDDDNDDVLKLDDLPPTDA